MDPILMRCHKCGWYGKIADLYLTYYCPECLCMWPYSVRFEIFLTRRSVVDFKCFS